MKQALVGIWTIAIMLFCFNICVFIVDLSFTSTIIYHLAVLVNGFMFGMVINEWLR